MKPITAEWVQKAEGDYATLLREARARKNPNYDGACFHAQQCAEKYFKARLCEADVKFFKVHDLVALLDLVLSLEPGWGAFRKNLAYLNAFAVSFRYPGEQADKGTAADARKLCQAFRQAARAALRLQTE